MHAPNDVWNEVRFTSEGISISLLSESTDGPAIVEDEMWFTYDELQALSPSEPQSLNLSQQTRERLSEQREDANIGRMLQSADLSEKAEHLPENPSTKELLTYMGFVDDGSRQSKYQVPNKYQEMLDENAPPWSPDDRVVVQEVTDMRSDEYVIDSATGRTVADANPSHPADAPVVVAEYVDGSKDYRFPVTRLRPT